MSVFSHLHMLQGLLTTRISWHIALNMPQPPIIKGLTRKGGSNPVQREFQSLWRYPVSATYIGWYDTWRALIRTRRENLMVSCEESMSMKQGKTAHTPRTHPRLTSESREERSLFFRAAPGMHVPVLLTPNSVYTYGFSTLNVCLRFEGLFSKRCSDFSTLGVLYRIE